MNPGLLKFCFIGFSVMLLALPEILLGSLGLAFPVVAPLVLYFVLAGEGRIGIWTAIGAGCWLDLVYGRFFPISVFALSALALTGWLFKQRSEGIMMPVGLILPAFVSLLAAEAVWAAGGMYGGTWSLTDVLLQTGMAIFLASLGTASAVAVGLLMDRAANLLGIDMAIEQPRSAARRTRGLALRK